MIRRLLPLWGHPDQPVLPPSRNDVLSSQLKVIHERCTDCGACTRHCAFLKRHGTPLVITETLSPVNREQLRMAFDCSLCGLCTAVCPQKLDPRSLFLDMRRQRVALGGFDKGPYRPLLIYETLGCSSLFSWFGLPDGCTAVFFPGCALPGTRPGVTLRMFQCLQGMIPTLGIVLKCCSKPSHDLGCTDVFLSNFNSILMRLRAHGITTVITACPSCTQIFRQYAPELAVQSAFTFLAAQGTVPQKVSEDRSQEVVVHDPCPLRDDPVSQEATRNLLKNLGYRPIAMRHQKNHTLCCGEGGSVGFVQPELSRAWTQQRTTEADGRPIVTTCAGCSAMLARSTRTLHLADLLFSATPNNETPPSASRPPMTYLNRLWLKLRLWRSMHTSN